MQTATRSASLKTAILGQLAFEPGADQLRAVSDLSEFVTSAGERSVFILRGYAGTGKTSIVSALTRALPAVKWRSVLLAPTGRAAKVFSQYSNRAAFTIHKKIFRPVIDSEGAARFALAENLHRNTLFIVDEASMIGASDSEGLSGSLLENLFEYVFSGENCKLVLVGDTAQLPPVGNELSPALDAGYLRNGWHLNVKGCEMTEVARQQSGSGILLNATALRNSLANDPAVFPGIVCGPDMVRLSQEDLADTINNALREYGEDNVIIITRSNKRAGLYNRSYRNLIRLYEEDLCTGDRVMIVKNNYFWLPEGNFHSTFIANGDMAEITRITRREELYGFKFCDCSVVFPDAPETGPLQVKLNLSALYSDNAALTADEMRELYASLLEDVSGEPSRSLRLAYVRKSPYYNALQVKFSYAITCHKAQGGQWPVVFIDPGFIREDEMSREFVRWLYTAITRASKQVYLLGFSDRMIM